MKKQIRTINSIEISSICDNSCEYCPARLQHKYREIGFMTQETFNKSLDIVKYFIKQQTQKELNLFGVGEPTLNPKVVEFVEQARRQLPIRTPIHMNTNGNTMTEELARDLKDAGISHIDITAHKARAAARTIQIFRKVGIEGNLSLDFITMPNNWAGQIDWPDCGVRYACPWLRDGQAMIQSDGNIVGCCLDAFATNILGSVDTPPNELFTSPSDLCRKCHQDIPREDSPLVGDAFKRMVMG